MENVMMAAKEGGTQVPTYEILHSNHLAAYQLVDDIVLKNYITNLEKLDLIALDQDMLESNFSDNVRIFKINEMVYQKDEYSTYKFASVFNAVQNMDCAVFIIADSDGQKTDFYMGVRALDQKRTVASLKRTLENALSGQFPGAKTANLLEDEKKELIDKIKVNSVASVSCVAKNKDAEFKNNQNYLQGFEKMALAMQGQKYTAIIIADGATQEQLSEVRKSYESLYTQLSPFANMQVSYGKNEALSVSDAFASGITKGSSHTDTTSLTMGTSESRGDSMTESNTESWSQTTNNRGYFPKIINAAEIAVDTIADVRGNGFTTKMAANTALVSGAFSTIAPVLKAVPYVGFLLGGIMHKMNAPKSIKNYAENAMMKGGVRVVAATQDAKNDGVSGATSQSRSQTQSATQNYSDTNGSSDGYNEGTSQTTTNSRGVTSATSENMQLTMQNKSISGILERIDLQLKRLQECESLGMWECAAYFLAENQETAEIAASTYKALMKGDNSGVEMSAVNCWGKQAGAQVGVLKDYITNFIHPIFAYPTSNGIIPVTPSALVSGNELAIQMGLPRKSICGFPVIEHSDFGKEVVRYNEKHQEATTIALGNVFNMGSVCKNSVKLEQNSLAMHTFITGSTGAGKSNAIYAILYQLSLHEIPFMVIEPAKGEYKHMFGHQSDVTVLGTNPEYTEMLRINPFKFPQKIHVLEHVDRLVEIFNVCWPMYAAMPAVLKDAMLEAYQVCGWDLLTSKNAYSEELFPTFADLQREILNVIESSAYADEVKSNYIGSLATRIKSLTNGLNGQIFSASETDNMMLFDQKVIVDLSRVGSLETKSLIMGILIMRLNEHRMCFAEGMNLPLRHVTILEEAHHILKRTVFDQNPESSNMTGKSVELLANSIAEMRTYGEGFIIADQSPNAVDMSAIRNTNTKIIMRLPDEADRRLVGKSASLKDEQIDEISKLPKGVAVVYQNDWLEPVLCKIKKFQEEMEIPFAFKMPADACEIIKNDAKFKDEILKLLLKGKVDNLDVKIDTITTLLNNVQISTKSKVIIYRLLNEYTLTGKLSAWEMDDFGSPAEIILRLSDESDRQVIKKAAGLNDLQMEEILRKARGIAEIAQSDWLECVLCKVDKFEKESLCKHERETFTWCEGENEAIKRFFNAAFAIEQKELSKDVVDKVRKWYAGLELSDGAQGIFEDVLEGNIIDNGEKIALLYNMVGDERINKIVAREDVINEVTQTLARKYNIVEAEAVRHINEVFRLYVPENIYVDILAEQAERAEKEAWL